LTDVDAADHINVLWKQNKKDVAAKIDLTIPSTASLARRRPERTLPARRKERRRPACR
jgi:hypothetical protein